MIIKDQPYENTLLTDRSDQNQLMFIKLDDYQGQYQQYFSDWRNSDRMFERLWNFITNQFKNKEQSRVVAVTSKSRLQTASRLKPQSLPRQFYGLTLESLNKPQKQDLNLDFKLIIEPSPKISQKQQQENAQFSEDIRDELSQLKESMEKLSISERRLVEAHKNTIILPSNETQRNRQIQTSKKRHYQLKNQYQSQIKDFLELKYSKELADYPPFTFEQFKQIHQFWKSKNRGHLQIKTTNFECVQKLTYKAIGGLDYGQWLNDDIINIYIEMLQRRFIKYSDTHFRILNSYFATNTLTKSELQIQRVVKKKGLDKSHALVMPVNNRNHWYFAVFQDQQLVVFDSMKHNESYYFENPIFKNALKFAKMFYDKQFQLRVRGDYPQQDNYYDCGVFMLMGIRDTLRLKQWSFHQGDIRFKRVQISHEILREKLLFTE